eukprot:269674-Chlamydomonas_euryale.AAC.2
MRENVQNNSQHLPAADAGNAVVRELAQRRVGRHVPINDRQVQEVDEVLLDTLVFGMLCSHEDLVDVLRGRESVGYGTRDLVDVLREPEIVGDKVCGWFGRLGFPVDGSTASSTR